MKCAIYIRVSTDEQVQQNQLPSIKLFAERRNLEICRIYSETASAWKAGHQKELAKLIQDARSGEFQSLIIWSLDRLTREGPSKILMIYKKLEDLGVSVISVQEPWTETPSEVKPLLLAVFGWVAEQESKRRSERTKAGIARKKAGGQKVGRKIGSRDKKKRNTEGYKLRHARERVKRAEADIVKDI